MSWSPVERRTGETLNAHHWAVPKSQTDTHLCPRLPAASSRPHQLRLLKRKPPLSPAPCRLPPLVKPAQPPPRQPQACSHRLSSEPLHSFLPGDRARPSRPFSDLRFICQERGVSRMPRNTAGQSSPPGPQAGEGVVAQPVGRWKAARAQHRCSLEHPRAQRPSRKGYGPQAQRHLQGPPPTCPTEHGHPPFLPRPLPQGATLPPATAVLVLSSGSPSRSLSPGLGSRAAAPRTLLPWAARAG